jgi:monofunctional biosynthetic peptidoglycan transglycosylase
MERSDSPRPPAADPAAEKAEQPKRAATGEPASGDEHRGAESAAPSAADPFAEAEPEATERGHFETIERETTQPVRRYFEPRNSAPPLKRVDIAEAVTYTPPQADDERPAYLDALSEAMRAHETPEAVEDEQLAQPALEPWPDPLSTTQPGARAQQPVEPVAAAEPEPPRAAEPEAAVEPPRAAEPEPATEPPQDPPAPPAPSFEPSPFQVMRPLPAPGPLSALAAAARARQAAAPEAKQEAPAETTAREPNVIEPVPAEPEVAPEPSVQAEASAPPSPPEITRVVPAAPSEAPPIAPPPPMPPQPIAVAPPPVRQDYTPPRPSPPSQVAPPFTRAEPAMRPAEPAKRPADPLPRPAPPPPSPAPRAPTLQHDVAAAWAPPQRREPSFYRDAPQPPAAEATAPESRDWRDLIRRAANVAFLIFAGWFVAVLLLIAVYRFVNPPFSMLMVQQALTGTSIDKQWVPIERISPNLSRAVIVAEDGRFCEHWGIDFVEMAHAVRRASDGYPRGASTITMQVAKNLFLVPTKSYLRKIVEVPLTFAIELAWPKWRILEIYLNIVEWGPGVFGAEAASRAHFGRPAASLSARQAAQLAVVLPNPIVRDAGSPGPRTSRRASTIQARAAGNRTASSCVDRRR